MKTDERLLQFFIAHEGEFLSGQMLADELGVTRAAVWKAIQKLTDAGHTIDSQHKVGYRYTNGQTLSAPIIKALSQTTWDVQVFDTLDSTNTYAKQALTNGAITRPTVIIANQQTAARGRLGRSFVAPAQTGLYVSFAWPLAVGAVVDPGLLTTGTAVAVRQAIQATLGVNLAFKWVNDLLFADKKVGGILTEAVMDFESQQISALVVGIGLNLVAPADLPVDLRAKVGGMVSDLTVSRNVIAAALINAFQTAPTADFLPEYRAHNIVIGQIITVQFGGKTITGKAVDIDNHGALIVQTPNERLTVHSGEITKLSLPNADYKG